MCDCNDDDVCPTCLDAVIRKAEQEILKGTASKKEVELKTFLLDIITDQTFVNKTKAEIVALRLLREKQSIDYY